MDGVQDSERPSVYHEHGPDTSPIAAELWAGNPPKLFMLIQEDEAEDDRITWEVTAYGIALPNGVAATVGATGTGFGSWSSPKSASRYTYSELVWLTR